MSAKTDKPKPVSKKIKATPRTLFSLPEYSELTELKLTICQEGTAAPGAPDNSLEIKTEDGGGGKYIVINGRWAMSNAEEVDQLAATLKKALDCAV